MARTRMPRRATRGALTTIGGLLIASAIVRFATGAGEALAREDVAPTEAQQAVAAEQTASDAPQRIAEADIQPILDAIEQRETRLQDREEALAVRLQALDVAEREIDEKLAQLAAAEASLRETLSLARDASETDIARLTDVYANMKPKQAAALFEEMDPRFAAGFLGRMRPDAAAAIMAGLSPQRAYTISVVLAGRNADVPKE